jgi:hypothetical protein
MDILVCWPDGKLAHLCELQDVVECLLERVQFLSCKHTDVLKHRHMGERSPHIMTDQACVEDAILGCLKAFHLRIGSIAFLPELGHCASPSSACIGEGMRD